MKARIAILAILLLAQSASTEGFQMKLSAPRLESSVSIEAALHQRRSLREYADASLVLADLAQRPIRYELIEFPEDSGGVRPGFPLRAGLHAVAFEVASLAQAMAALPAARFGPIARLASQARPTTRAVVSAEGPGGVRLELWEAIPAAPRA